MISEAMMKKYYPTKEELEQLGEYADMECVFDNDSEIQAHDIPLPTPTDNPKSEEIVSEILKIVIMGEPDYAKAFEIYARAAALIGNYEALYKFGDMYSRGKAIVKDMKTAVLLWLKSYDVSESPVQRSHPAFRLAKILISENAEEYGLEYDPLSALNLFQEAEFGFRIEIKNGCMYYEKNMNKAIEGQKKARELLDYSVLE